MKRACLLGMLAFLGLRNKTLWLKSFIQIQSLIQLHLDVFQEKAAFKMNIFSLNMLLSS